METREVGIKLKEKLGLRYFPIGVSFSDSVPDGSKKFKDKGKGCIVPLIFLSAKGQTVSVDKNSTGLPCSAFYLGYQNWIFPGIENFLSDGTVFGRTGERFFKTPEMAKTYVKSLVPAKINDRVTIFKPLEKFEDSEKPELVIFFANADELSGVVYLLNYSTPTLDDMIVTKFGSGCASIVTIPMKLKAEGKKQAVWGMHDISVRTRLPKDIMTLSMPYSMVTDMINDIDNSFVITEAWEKIKNRNI